MSREADREPPPTAGEPVTWSGRRAALGLALFSAVTALGGGGALLLASPGSPALPPLTVLQHTPFGTFLVPGLLLTLVVGGTSLVAAALAWRRAPAWVDATILAGGTLTVWIVAEAAMMRVVHGLHLGCGAVGAALLGVGAWTAWRSALPRHRWVLTVTMTTALGFLVTAGAGVFAVETRVAPPGMLALMTLGGLIEGACIGAGQALALPLPVRRLRYTLLTALPVGLTWLLAMTPIVSVWLLLSRASLSALALVVLPLQLLGVGAAQWLELRHHASRGRGWIAWSALAWAAAAAVGSAPPAFVDHETPLVPNLVLWACGAAVVGYTMAIITWQGVRGLGAARGGWSGAEAGTSRRA